jgi:hypothetical protein
VCILCDPTCASCQGTFDHCSSCNAAYNRQLVGAECLCLVGYLEAGVLCLVSSCPSDPLCFNCLETISGLKVCTQCVAGVNRVLNSSLNRCVCKDGFFDDFGLCVSCAAGCQVCSSLTVCLSCATLATAQTDGSCLCPKRTFLAVSGDLRFCQNCPELCSTCLNASYCQLCQPSARFYDGACLCIDGYYHNLTTSSCEPCPAGCTYCTVNGC